MRSTPRREPRRRRLARALGLAGVCASLLGCPDLPDGPRFHGAGHDSPRHGGTLMLSETSRVRTLDPHEAFDVTSGSIIEMIFDGLYTYDMEMKARPNVAASLPIVSPDGQTFTVPLRQGIRFQNGRELVADDVVWSLERMLHPDTHSPGAEYFNALEGWSEYRAGKAPHVSGLRAKDRYTVELRLTRSDQSFVHVLAMRFAVPLPREEVKRLGKDFARRPVGSGPFRLVSWDPGVRLVLERNPSYFRKPFPYLDRVIVDESIPPETAFLRFRNGDEDIITRVGPADRAVLQNSPKWRPYNKVSPSVDVYGLVMNCELAPFDNVHVRRAVAYAIDRKRWAKARNDGIRPTGQIIPPQLPGYDEHMPGVQYFDLAKAKEEMRLAGYPKGLPKPVTLWIGESASARAQGQLAQADLEKIGVQVELKQVSFPVYLEATGTRKTAQMLAAGWVMDFPDPSNFIGLLHSKMATDIEAVNRSFYKNPVMDDLLDRGLIERDPDKRTALYRQANELASRDAPWAFFGNSQVPHAWQPYVRNYAPHPSYEIPINEVWLDLPKKRVALLAAALGPLGPLTAMLEGGRP